MIEYAIRRLVYGALVVVGVTIMVFLLMRVLPGDAVTVMMQSASGVSPEEADRLRAEFGLNQPVYVQLAEWVSNAVRGDLGRSFYTDEPVVQMFVERAPITLQLLGMTVVFGVVVGLTLGIVSAARHGSATDNALRVVSIAGLSVPNFVLGTLLLTFFAIVFAWSPPVVFRGPLEDFPSYIQQMILPAVALGTASVAGVARMTRSSMLETLQSNFIRTVRAKGARERVIFLKHSLRNASIPVFTLVGQQVATILGGTVILEAMFSIQGTGQLIYESVLERDYPVVVACTVFYAAVYVGVVIVVDLMYALLDPRIRYGRR